MTKYFTGSGDDGTTGYLGKGRIVKNDLRMEALGSLDECSAQLGVVRNLLSQREEKDLIKQLQKDLYKIMAEVAADLENAERFRGIHAEQIAWLEDRIQFLGEGVTMPSEFILPGETLAGAHLSVARAIARRAERRVVEMSQAGLIQNTALLSYMNRLSSLLYVLELRVVQFAGIKPSIAKA